MIALLLWLALLLAPPAPPDRAWPVGPVLNQGSAPICVAEALLGWEEAAPGALPAWQLPSAAWIYTTAHARDGFRGPHAGTTVAAGWAALLAAGDVLPGSARYTRDRVVAAGWLAAGPVVLETDWYPSMDSPGPGGWVTVVPQAEHSRHAVFCYGLAGYGAAWTCRNSWGADWGDHGDFVLRAADLDRLLAANGWLSQAEKAPRGAE